MQDRHQNKKRYFKEQGRTTEKFVIPYIEEVKPIKEDSRILEIGCGEAGNLTPFIERNLEVVGVDLSATRIDNAKSYIHETYPDANVRLIASDIYKMGKEDIGTFDIIFLRDVIEHLPNQSDFMSHMKAFLKPEGVVFFGFPPWRMPFGGHQQICKSKILSKLPYFHILPKPIYKLILRAFGESQSMIQALDEIKDTRISINRFQRIVKSNGYVFMKKTFWLINPNYETKFGLKPRKQFKLIQSIPHLRDSLTTCMYSVIGLEK